MKSATRAGPHPDPPQFTPPFTPFSPTNHPIHFTTMKKNQSNASQKRSNLFTQTALVLATVLLLGSCAPDKEQVAPVGEAGGPEQATSQAGAVPSPLSGEVAETPDKLPFPQGNSATGRTAYGEAGVVHFNDTMALFVLPQKAALTYASWPFYIQKVGSAWINVKENNGAEYKEAFRSNYGHYLLPFQNFLPCIINNGTFSFGKPSGGSCLPIRPAQEPRTLSTHYGDQWIKIFAYDKYNYKRVFDLAGVTILNGPVQVWFRHQNGTWKAWKNLSAGKFTTNQANGITEVLIGSAAGKTFGIDNIQLRVPAY